MKRTSKLAIMTAFGMNSDIFFIHPNDGFDLGLMTREHAIAFHTGITAERFLQGESGTAQQASLELKNECPAHTIQMAQKIWDNLGKPESVVIFLEGNRAFFHGTA